MRNKKHTYNRKKKKSRKERGEKLFKKDFCRNMKMFEVLMGSIVLYGSEVL